MNIKETGRRILEDIEQYWAAALVLVVYTIIVNFSFNNFCPMVIISGLPCPGCGLTRAVLYLFSGKIQQSLYINPMGIPIVCILIYFFGNRYILGKKAKGITALIVISVTALLILYFGRMYLFFPDRVPYIYNKNNILSKTSVFYEQMLHEFGIL